jgi:hypothetical protein
MLLFRRNVRTTALALFLLDLVFVAGFDGLFFIELRNRAAINNIEGLPSVLAIVIVITLTLTYAVGLYRRDSVTAPLTAMGRLPIALGLGGVAQAAIMLAVLSQVYPDEIMYRSLSRCFGLIMVTAGVSFCAAGVARGVFDLLMRRNLFRRAILVVGTGRRADHLQRSMTTDVRRPMAELHFVPESVLTGLDMLGPPPPGALAADTVTRPAGRSKRSRARSAPMRSWSRRMSAVACRSKACSNARSPVFPSSITRPSSSAKPDASTSVGSNSAGSLIPRAFGFASSTSSPKDASISW